MVYQSAQNGMLGVILPRIIDSGHQVASTYVFSARDPSVFKDLGTASSHSFGNFVVPESRGGFLGVDLGDNYPRGVHLHRFNPLGMANRVVYTYKTVHLPFPRKEGSAVYKEIEHFRQDLLHVVQRQRRLYRAGRRGRGSGELLGDLRHGPFAGGTRAGQPPRGRGAPRRPPRPGHAPHHQGL